MNEGRKTYEEQVSKNDGYSWRDMMPSPRSTAGVSGRHSGSRAYHSREDKE